MREVLFRGKTKQGEWVYGQYCELRDGKTTIPCIYYMGEIIKETLGQYTGLTDKNGKEIFEGDVLQTGTRMGYILFEKGCFKFRWKNCDKYREDFFKTCILTEYGSFKELEVIGNIHDNPELLKGGAE